MANARALPLPKWPPSDFLVADDPLLRDIDGLIYMLLSHRETVAADRKPKRATPVRDIVTRLIHALHHTEPGKTFAQQSIVIALDAANDEGFARTLGARWTIAFRVGVAEMQLRVRLPGVAVPSDVLQRAVELWREPKKAERTVALHALAKALSCDVRNITQALRTAKSKWRAENLARARARRAKGLPPKRRPAT